MSDRLLTSAARPDGPSAPARDTRAADGPAPVPLRLFVLVAVGCFAVLAWCSRKVFLFSDDYMFLDDGRQMPFDLDYLRRILFTHFSPTTRAIDAGLVGLLPGRSWLVFAVLMLCAAAVIASSATLMVALFGRTRPALIGTASLGTSLSLLPLTNWQTAGVNIMPALASTTLCFAALVLLVRGRSRWWALVAIVSYSIAVLGWELAMLIPGYALIWTLLFWRRVTTTSLAAVARRTWWVWTVLAVIGGASLLNYYVNYYQPAPSARKLDLLHAMYISLFETTLPTYLGFHDPSTGWFRVLGTILGAVVFAFLLVHSFRRSAQAWRGWLFALAGWAVPCAGFVLNRVGFFGVVVAEIEMYFFLPSMLLLVGVFEALSAPPRPGFVLAPVWRPEFRRHRRIAAAVAIVVIALAYTRSAPATIRSLFEFGAVAGTSAPERDYVRDLLASADGISTDRSTFSIINSDVPAGLVPPGFSPYNRLDRVAAVNDSELRFGAVDGTHWKADDDGRLHEVELVWDYQRRFTSAADIPALDIHGARDVRFEEGRGICATLTDPNATMSLLFGETFGGRQMVVQTEYWVDVPTTERLMTIPPEGPFLPANVDQWDWQPGRAGQIDTVSQLTPPGGDNESVALNGISFDTLNGNNVCIGSISVGTVVPVG